MAVELQLVLRFEDSAAVPLPEDLEEDLDCIVIEWVEDQV